MLPYDTFLLNRESLGTCLDAVVETLELLVDRMYTGNLLDTTEV